MALFSRRPKPEDAAADEAPAAAPDDTVASPDAGTPPDAGALPDAGTSADAAAVEAVPHVGISMSSFGAPPRTPKPTAAGRPPAEAPPSETEAGVSDNVLLREAVDAFTVAPDPTRLMNVARQLMQGQVYLRVKGDVQAMLGEGGAMPFAVAIRGDEQLAVLFSGGKALQTAIRADGVNGTSALGQPASVVLRHVLAGSYGGVVIDSWPGRTSPVLPRALIQVAMDEVDPRARIKTLLAAVRTPATASEVVSVLAEQRVWLAANQTAGSQQWGVAESRTSGGVRRLSVFSHPLEVAALGRGDRPVPITPAQLGKALASDAALAGLLVDPGGPWIQIDRDDLAPLMALADVP